jgi:hypothetical protein
VQAEVDKRAVKLSEAYQCPQDLGVRLPVRTYPLDTKHMAVIDFGAAR